MDIYTVYLYQTTNLLNAPRNLHGKLLAGRPRSKCFLYWNRSFRETLDQMRFCCKVNCWKVTKYDLNIFCLTVSAYILLNGPRMFQFCFSCIARVDSALTHERTMRRLS